MDVKIVPGRLNGTVNAIPSKSQAHRALICAALADKPTRIVCGSDSDDINATVACLSALGATIAREGDSYNVYPLSREKNNAAASRSGGAKDASDEITTKDGNDSDIHLHADDNAFTILPCAESGSTFRFLLPIAGALGRNAAFMLKGRLPDRPLSPLYEALINHGCKLSPPGASPFYASGQLTSGCYTLDASVSSQFVSGLLFALPILDGDSEIRLTGRAESFPYIEMTLAMLDKFHIKAYLHDMVFSIAGRQVYCSPGEARVEGDWSNAAFWLCAGAINTEIANTTNSAGNIACAGLDIMSRQGDRAILDILTRFGARCTYGGDTAIVSGGKITGIEIDVRDIPDLAPILAVVAAVAEGTTVIKNAGRLRAKESDRLSSVTGLLRGLGADITEKENGMIIHGGVALTGGQVFSRGDHRIAMAAAIAATVCAAPVIIRDAEAVNKSYPGFFDDFRSLGGKYQII